MRAPAQILGGFVGGRFPALSPARVLPPSVSLGPPPLAPPTPPLVAQGLFSGFCAVGSEEAHLAALTSVRLPNWTCRFPASSFHNGEHLLGCKEGMGWNKLPCPPPSQPSLPLQDFSSQPVSWANQVRVFLSGNFPPA